MKYSRRVFVNASLLLCLIYGTGRLAWHGIGLPQLVERVIFRRLHYLVHDRRGVTNFAHDLCRYHHLSPLLTVVESYRFLLSPLRLFFEVRGINDLDRFEEWVCQRYLISSNFFESPHPPAVVVYAGGAGVSFQACRNPFARFDFLPDIASTLAVPREGRA